MQFNRLLFFIFLMVFLGACSLRKAATIDAPQTTTKEEVTVESVTSMMTFDRVFHDFGKIKRGEKKSTVFHFTNTGKEDLVIEIATSCECTTLDYPTHPIAPGGKGQIDVLFDSTTKEENEEIDVTIILQNTNPVNGYPIVEEVKYTYELIEE